MGIEELHSHLQEEQDFHTAGEGLHIDPGVGEAGHIDLVGEDIVAGEVVAHTPAVEVHHMEVAHTDLEVVLVAAHIDLGAVVRNLAADSLEEEAGRMEVAQVVRRSLVAEGGIDCIQAEENVLGAAGRHIHRTAAVDMPS